MFLDSELIFCQNFLKSLPIFTRLLPNVLNHVLIVLDILSKDVDVASSISRVAFLISLVVFSRLLSILPIETIALVPISSHFVPNKAEAISACF